MAAGGNRVPGQNVIRRQRQQRQLYLVQVAQTPGGRIAYQCAVDGDLVALQILHHLAEIGFAARFLAVADHVDDATASLGPGGKRFTRSQDGVVHFESRFAPLFHTRKGLTHQQIVSAVLKGLERGRKDFGVRSGLIICAMRNMNVSLEMAELAVDFRERGVVGFDLAGEEGGYPPKKHVEAFHYIQRENFNITVHAGEGYGKESIWQAIQYCGAHRIGHGTRLIDDIAVKDGKAVNLGDLAQYVLDKRIPLEICLLSNVHTGATPSLADHPFKILYQEKFRVTLNTDNRLMSHTSMTQEFEAAAETFGLTMDDFEKITINAMKSAFLPYDQRIEFIYSIIKPGYAGIRKSARLPS